MTIIDRIMDDCVLMDKVSVPDGQGGSETLWKEGASVKIAIVNNTSIPTRVAEKEGFTSTYTLTTKKNLRLEFHDVVKRVEDGLVLRVTSDTVQFPKVASERMKDYAQVSAEKWSLTS